MKKYQTNFEYYYRKHQQYWTPNQISKLNLKRKSSLMIFEKYENLNIARCFLEEWHYVGIVGLNKTRTKLKSRKKYL